jgi:hypothetical protein
MQRHFYQIDEIARVLGLRQGRSNDLSPCPRCGATQRGRSDKRGPIGMTADRMGWCCHRCDAKGSAASLFQMITGKALNAFQSSDKTNLAALESVNQRTKAPRPPVDEVMDTWNRSAPVVDDNEVRDWLQERGFDANRIADRDLVRALPLFIILPGWCVFKGQKWNCSGHRLIAPMFGGSGELESLHARCIRTGVPRSDKAAAPLAGTGSLSGVVMADGLGRQILQNGTVPEWWSNRQLEIVLVEGEPDFLVWATQFGDSDEYAPAVMAVVAGSWTYEISRRIPTGSVVIVRTHNDQAGERYAQKIYATVGGHCEVLRKVG